MMFALKSSKVRLCVTFAVLFFVSSAHDTAQADDALVLAVHPYLPHEEIIKKFTPIADYLGKQIGKNIEVRVGSNYDEHIQYAGLDKVDIAYMGPASYVRLTKEFGSKPILARLEIKGKPWFQGDIITRRDSGIHNLQDLKGKLIAYGDPDSTMSYIVPHYMLKEAGVYSDPSSKYQFLYSHINVALGVLSGDFDAGAVKPAVFRKFEKEGLRSIAKTPRISEHLFITQTWLPSKQLKALRQAMLNMKNTEEGLAALHSIKQSITGLVEASDRDYENLRTIMFESDRMK